MLPFLLKLTLAWGLFALLYTTLLRRETFFRINRIYLLATALLGVLLPFSGRLLPEEAAGFYTAWLPEVSVGFLQAAETTPCGAWLPALIWIYVAGAALAAVRTLWGLAAIVRMAKGARAERLSDDCLMLRTDATALPLSFFRWIFVPLDFQADGREEQAILSHERAHARGWHSADVLLAESLCIVFWFHPLAHWYRRALRSVHEYLADAGAVAQSDRKQYGLLLIRQTRFETSLAMVHHFFQSPLKQRLLMLTRQTSPLTRAWKYALLLPALAFFLILFRGSAAARTEEKLPNLNEAALPEFPGGQQALANYLGGHIQYPERSKQAGVAGTVILELSIEKDGTISEVREAKKSTPGREELVAEAIRVVSGMPKWLPAQSGGAAVRARFVLPIKFKLD